MAENAPGSETDDGAQFTQASGSPYRARSSENSFARPLTDFVAMGEVPARYDELVHELYAQHQPIGRAEELEVERMAVCWWRLHRAWRYENCASRLSSGEDRQNIMAEDGYPLHSGSPYWLWFVPSFH